MEVWPSAISGWSAGMIQGLRADYALEFVSQRSEATEAHQHSLELGALSQLAWVVLLCPAQVPQALLQRRGLPPFTLASL
eukprot:9872715-Alexandrium_andersonii.AAC.1